MAEHPSKPVPVTGVVLRGLIFPVPEKHQKNPGLMELDANDDGFLDMLDGYGKAEETKCDSRCRAETYLGLFNEKWKMHADFLLDLADAVFSTQVAYSAAFCLEGFLANADNLDLETPLPCCLPLDMPALAFANASVMKMARKYGWRVNYELAGLHNLGNITMWDPGQVYSASIGMDAKEMRLLTFIAVPEGFITKHPAAEIVEPIFARFLSQWNMLSALTADARLLSYCVPSAAYLYLSISDQRQRKGGEKDALSEHFEGLNMPIIVIKTDGDR